MLGLKQLRFGVSGRVPPYSAVVGVYLVLLVVRCPTTNRNKYAIYAYTHGPVTGSGPSVVTPLLAVLPPLCSYSQLVAS